MRRAFTLLECVLALAMLGLAAGLIVQVCHSAILVLENDRRGKEMGEQYRLALRRIVLIEDKETLEDGDTFELPDDAEIRWETVSIEPTRVLDLFRVELEMEYQKRVSFGEDIEAKRRETLFLYRPASGGNRSGADWYEPGEREDLLQDKEDEWEDLHPPRL